MKKITLVIFGNTHHELMKFSLNNSIKSIEKEIEKVLIFSDVELIPGLTHITINETLGLQDYNHFCLKKLNDFIDTEFVLLIQYDGMAINYNFWNDQFYNYDYIGAPWPKRFGWIKESDRVGNGGFSLRSKKLLESLSNFNFLNEENFNEDVIICQKHRQDLIKTYGIKYAPIELADNFSHEWNNFSGKTFGFHGVFNIPLYFNEEETIRYMDILNRKHWWYSDQYEQYLNTCKKRGFEYAIVRYS